MEIKDYLIKTKKEIENELNRQLDLWLKETSSSNPLLAPYLNTFVKACGGGKRLRGILIKLGYEMAGGSNVQINKVASACEIFQTAILIHDDLIDKSQMRRGIPSVYASLGTDHHGKSQAICLGDLGSFLSLRLIAETDFPPDLKGKAVLLMSGMMHDTVLGQMGDIDGAKNRNIITQKEILAVYFQKTAVYSFIGPMQIGGVLGGMKRKELAKLAAIGKYLGIAYQTQDDIFSVVSDERILGKSVSSDIREGKASLIYYYAFHYGEKEKKRLLEKYYGNLDINSGQIKEVQDVFISTGAVEFASNIATDYLNLALKEIDKLETGVEMKKMFRQFTEYLFERVK